MRFTGFDLHLPGWGLFGGADSEAEERRRERARRNRPISADISIEKVDGRELRVARWRTDKRLTRPPLLFFNGIGANIEAVAPLAETLTERGFVMFDMPGTGESPDPVMPYTPVTMSWTAMALLERFGISQVDVMGMSWGGTLAQNFALQHPSLVRKVVLAATSPGMLMIPGDPNMLAQMADPRSAMNEMLMREYMTALENMDDEGRVKNSIGQITAPSSRGYLYQLMAVAGWSSLPALPFLDKPVLVMMGENDPIVPLANGKLLASTIPNARLEVFEDAGHLFLVTHPKRVLSILREFLDAREDADG